jgi:hypothetical protein
MDRARRLREIRAYARERVSKFQTENERLGIDVPTQRKPKRRKSVYERKLQALGLDEPMSSRVAELGPPKTSGDPKQEI